MFQIEYEEEPCREPPPHHYTEPDQYYFLSGRLRRRLDDIPEEGSLSKDTTFVSSATKEPTFEQMSREQSKVDPEVVVTT